VVKLPEGVYALRGVLAILKASRLKALGAGPHTSQFDKGTTLFAFAGRDNAAGAPFISLKTRQHHQGRHHLLSRAESRRHTPVSVDHPGQGQHYNVIDVTIANAYDGVDCGTFHNEGHTCATCCCAPYIAACSSTAARHRPHRECAHTQRLLVARQPALRLTGDQVKALEAYTKENLTGFTIGRTDWEYISNSFVLWAKIGFHFRRVAENAGNVLVTQSGSTSARWQSKSMNCRATPEWRSRTASSCPVSKSAR
jgi:hypothetical protein